MIRKRITFFGRVQGVGFRYIAINAANSLGLTGWVRNERDGSVSMEVQGYEVGINRLIETIRNGSHISVDNIVDEEIPLKEKERGFSVKWL